MPRPMEDDALLEDPIDASSDNEALSSSETCSKAFIRGMMEHPPEAWLRRERTRHLEISKNQLNYSICIKKIKV